MGKKPNPELENVTDGDNQSDSRSDTKYHTSRKRILSQTTNESPISNKAPYVRNLVGEIQRNDSYTSVAKHKTCGPFAFISYIQTTALSKLLVLCISVVVFTFILSRFTGLAESEFVVWTDIATNIKHSRRKCSSGFFSLDGMEECRRWLSCADFNKIKILKKLGSGAVKVTYLAQWESFLIAYTNLLGKPYRDDFNNCIQMLKGLSGSEYVTQFVGQCGEAYLTEYYPLGTLQRLQLLENDDLYSSAFSIIGRLNLCIGYVKVLAFLHSSPLGTRVMCDSNDLEKTLEQYLVREDFHIVANDLDALPKVDLPRNVTIKCGHRELGGDFIAPEQLWPYDDKPFNSLDMPGYTEKVDIWKVPDVCHHFLGESFEAEVVRMHLFKIHNQCKMSIPEKRPTAEEILKWYMNTLQFFAT